MPGGERVLLNGRMCAPLNLSLSVHQQPRKPLAARYYDLCDPEVMLQQAELARGCGINGFVFYHYWFHGKRLLETPVQSILEDRRFTMPFCFCWANESWTRRWDGKESDVLLEQTYSPEDDRAHIRALLPIFKDERYLKTSRSTGVGGLSQ